MSQLIALFSPNIKKISNFLPFASTIGEEFKTRARQEGVYFINSKFEAFPSLRKLKRKKKDFLARGKKRQKYYTNCSWTNSHVQIDSRRFKNRLYILICYVFLWHECLLGWKCECCQCFFLLCTVIDRRIFEIWPWNLLSKKALLLCSGTNSAKKFKLHLRHFFPL